MESAANVTFLLQRLLRSLSSPLLSWGSTQASPFTFTKEMIDFFFDQKSDIALFTYLDFDILCDFIDVCLMLFMCPFACSCAMLLTLPMCDVTRVANVAIFLINDANNVCFKEL